MFYILRLAFLVQTLIHAVASTSPRLDIPKELRDMYLNCSEAASDSHISCVGVGKVSSQPENCITHYECNHLINYTPNDTSQMLTVSVASTLNGKRRFFIAVGFGQFALMDHALVIGCIRYDDKVSIHASWNTNNRFNIYKPKYDSVVRPRKSQILQNKYLYCEFDIQYHPKLDSHEYSLNTSYFHILVAQGTPRSPKELNYHGAAGSFLDAESVLLKKRHVRDISHDKVRHLNSFKIHAIAMLAAYIFFIPISMMTARFYKESCNHWKICERRPWFSIHLCGTIAAVIMIWGSSFFYYTTVGTYRIKTHRAKFHYYFGIATMVLTTIAASLGIMVVCINASYVLVRQIVSTLHWLFATIAYVMGLSAILLSPYSMPYYLKFCAPIELLMIIWVLLHGCFYGFLSMSMYARDRLDVLVYQAILAKLSRLQEGRLRTKTQLLRKSYGGLDVQGNAEVVSTENFAVTTEHFEKASKIMNQINYNKIIVSKYVHHPPSTSSRRQSIAAGWLLKHGSLNKNKVKRVEPEDKQYKQPEQQPQGRRGTLEKPPELKIMTRLRGMKSGDETESGAGRRQYLSLPGHHHRSPGSDVGERKSVSFRGSDISSGFGSEGIDDNDNTNFLIPTDEFDEQIALSLLHNFEDRHTGEAKRAVRTFIQFPLRDTNRENPDTFKIMVVLIAFAALCFTNFCLLVYFFNLDLSHRGCQRASESKFTFSQQFLQLWDVS